MPLVKVRYTRHPVLTDELLSSLGPALCVSVANNFDCGGDGALTDKDIEVMFTQASPFDVSSLDVVIELEAKHYPLRDKGDEATGQPNFKARVGAMGEDIGNMLPEGVSFGIWAKLNNAEWYEEDATVTMGSVSSDGDAWDPKTGKRPSEPVNWGYAGPR